MKITIPAFIFNGKYDLFYCLKEIEDFGLFCNNAQYISMLYVQMQFYKLFSDICQKNSHSPFKYIYILYNGTLCNIKKKCMYIVPLSEVFDYLNYL